MTALYPNGEADISRDKVLQVHVEKLREKVTPGHKDLKIPRSYQYECPWPSAQVYCLELTCNFSVVFFFHVFFFFIKNIYISIQLTIFNCKIGRKKFQFLFHELSNFDCFPYSSATFRRLN